jgi:MOSC domain-containing protein YiiM
VAEVVSICFTPAGIERKPAGRYARVAVAEVALVEGHGIDGDAKGGGRRQLNVMLAEVVTQLRAEGYRAGPGELGEQIVLAGVDPAALAPGARLRLGAAVIEVVKPRTGCGRFEAIQGRSKESVAGRLGVMARVITGGVVRVGDAVLTEDDAFAAELERRAEELRRDPSAGIPWDQVRDMR